ncbi:hypothetical protein [Aquimonas sp.]|uniref:hypothetical protein n=1 Tax=Aquimonas sp. TaxID=1872588 RepID=UPI0037C0F756
MARFGFFLLLLVLLLLDPRPAFAEVWRISPKLDQYVQLLFPDRASGRLYYPLVLVMPDSSRVEQVILPGNRHIDALIETLNGERRLESADTGIENGRYHAAVTTLAGDAPLQFPLVVFVRLAPPRSESDVQIPAAASGETMEAALSAWVGDAEKRNLLIVSLLPR